MTTDIAPQVSHDPGPQDPDSHDPGTQDGPDDHDALRLLRLPAVLRGFATIARDSTERFGAHAVVATAAQHRGRSWVLSASHPAARDWMTTYLRDPRTARTLRDDERGLLLPDLRDDTTMPRLPHHEGVEARAVVLAPRTSPRGAHVWFAAFSTRPAAFERPARLAADAQAERVARLVGACLVAAAELPVATAPDDDEVLETQLAHPATATVEDLVLRIRALTPSS